MTDDLTDYDKLCDYLRQKGMEGIALGIKANDLLRRIEAVQAEADARKHTQPKTDKQNERP